MKDYVLVSETLGDRDFFGRDIFTEEDARSVKGPTFLGTIKKGDQVLAKGAFALRDVTNKQVGIIMTLTDVTEMMNTEKMALIYLVIAAGALFLVSYLFTFLYLKKIIIDPLIKLCNSADEISKGKLDAKMVANRTDEIGQLIHSFDRMRISIKKFLSMMAKNNNK